MGLVKKVAVAATAAGPGSVGPRGVVNMRRQEKKMTLVGKVVNPC